MKKIMVLDGHSVVFRAFHAVPELVTSGGIYTNAIYGFVNMLLKITGQYKPNAVVAAFDLKEPTFRHKMFDGYKAGRSATPETLIPQIDMLKELLEKMGVTVIGVPGFEADDILGTMSRLAGEAEVQALLVTGDRDSLQLIDGNTTVLYTKKGVSALVEYDEAEFLAEYGISPKQFVDCKALMGDNSDNIPGVAGIGPKTAVGLLQEYGTLDGIYDHVDQIKSKSVQSKLIEGKDNAYMSRTLAGIVKNAPIELPQLSDEPYEPVATDEFCRMLSMLEMNKLLESLKAKCPEGVACNATEYIPIDIDECGFDGFIAEAREKKAFSVFVEGTGAIKEGCRLLWTADNVYTSSCGTDELCRAIKDILEDECIAKSLQDTKALMHVCHNEGIVIKNAAFDYSVAAYLLDAVSWRSDVDYFGVKFIGADWKNDARALGNLEEKMLQSLTEQGMLELYRDIEHPLIEVLYDMELSGFTVDISMLQSLGRDYDQRIAALTDKIFGFAGEEFNINSTKQLSHVLFEVLGLKPVKKTKTGYSTDNEVLEALRDDHEIVESIIEYRQLVKLKSTYIDGLISAADQKGRVHTTFNQTITNTGRLSSTEPNLQNIPVRTAEGARIREAFVAGDSDYVLVDADYSQIELRVFAHMSGDKRFIDAFVNGEDIHRATAARVFGSGYDFVTDEMRSQAKAVNFGIIYGISDFGLARNLSVSKQAAKKIIDEYFEKFPTISAYMEESAEFARQNGYCKTLFGRRRSCNDINSKNFMLRKAAERIAVNMPVQGSAADIIKAAMVKVYNELKNRGLRSRLILQVHDELVVLTHKDEVDSVIPVLKECMENACKLDAPLVADVGCGNTWGEAKA